jgi:hypothetical protein
MTKVIVDGTNPIDGVEGLNDFDDVISIEIFLDNNKKIIVSLGKLLIEIHTPDKGLIVYPQDFRTIFVGIEK